jgi:hypothetical protein
MSGFDGEIRCRFGREGLEGIGALSGIADNNLDLTVGLSLDLTAGPTSKPLRCTGRPDDQKCVSPKDTRLSKMCVCLVFFSFRVGALGKHCC